MHFTMNLGLVKQRRDFKGSRKSFDNTGKICVCVSMSAHPKIDRWILPQAKFKVNLEVPPTGETSGEFQGKQKSFDTSSKTSM